MASDIRTLLPRAPSALPGNSAHVRIELSVGDRLLFPTHTAPDFLIFGDPQTLSPSNARLLISVDGQSSESTVEILPHLSPATRIPIRLIAGT